VALSTHDKPTEDQEMKLHTMFLGSALVAAVAMGGCDSSKAELEKTKADLATVTTERDGLKTQLDTATTHEKELTSQVADLNAKLAAAEPAKAAATKGTEHAQMTPAKKDGAKSGKNTAQASSHKKG
jgi:outer membrane murein-binding lipoprotein Lpp